MPANSQLKNPPVEIVEPKETLVFQLLEDQGRKIEALVEAQQIQSSQLGQLLRIMGRLSTQISDIS